MEDVIREANDGPEYLFISFDIDVIDPAFVQGPAPPSPVDCFRGRHFPS